MSYDQRDAFEVVATDDGYRVIFLPNPLHTHTVFPPGVEPWTHVGTLASFRACGMENDLPSCFKAIQKHRDQMAELKRLREHGVYVEPARPVSTPVVRRPWWRFW